MIGVFWCHTLTFPSNRKHQRSRHQDIINSDLLWSTLGSHSQNMVVLHSQVSPLHHLQNADWRVDDFGRGPVRMLAPEAIRLVISVVHHNDDGM